MTDEQLTVEFARLNEQMTALVGYVSNIEAVVAHDARVLRQAKYDEFVATIEAGNDGEPWRRVNQSDAQDGVQAGDIGLEELDLTASQLAAVQKKLDTARTREVLEQQRKASRSVKAGKRRGR